MKRSRTNKDALYKYLTPLLEAGANESTLVAARKQYIKEYKARWQREHRKANKQFTVSFSSDELTVIEKAAGYHHRSLTKFIKEAALAYCSNRFLVPDAAAVNHIRQLLTMNYCLLQQILEEHDHRHVSSEQLTKMVSSLEKQVLDALHNPKQVPG